MTPNTLRKALRKAGLNAPEQHAALLSIQQAEREAAEKTSAETTHKRRWNALLEPLNTTIRGLQSNRNTTWGNDPLRGPVFAKYLELLIKTRALIWHTRLHAAADEPLRSVAQRLGLDGNGSNWPDWVSANTKAKVHAAFDYLYNVALPASIPATRHTRGMGKRSVPFTIAGKSKASDKRWTILLGVVSVRAAQLGPEIDSDSVYAKALRYALDRIRSHKPNEVAPVNWTHLLEPEMQEQYKAWREGSMAGLSDKPLTREMLEAAQAAQVRQMIDAQDALEAARVERRRKRMEYAREYNRDYQREVNRVPVSRQRGPYKPKSEED